MLLKTWLVWLLPIGLTRLGFGGGGGGGGGNTTTTTQNYSPAEAARRAQVMDEAARVYEGTKDTLANSPYPGSAPVPFSSDTLTAQDWARYAASNSQPQIDAINSGVRFGLGDVMDVNSNPYLQSAIQAAIAPITQSYSGPGGALQQIRTGANEAGQFGGSRQGIAEGIAASNYMGQVGNTAAKMASEGYNQGLDTFEKTLMFAPTAMETAMQPASWLSSVGAQNEALAQAQADYGANARMWGLNAPWMGLQNYANIVYGAGSGGTTSSTSGGGYQRSPLTGALGGAAMGYSIGGPWGAAAGALLGLMD